MSVENGQLHVIHFARGSDDVGCMRSAKVTIHEETIYLNSQRGYLYRIDYPPDVTQYNPVELVVARAECERANQVPYWLTSNNCESFATYCKRGVNQTQQGEWAWHKGKRLLRHMVLRLILMAAWVLFELFIAELIKSVFEVNLRKDCMRPCKASYQMIGAGIFVAFELGYFCYDYHKLRCEWTEGHMYRREYCFRVMVRFTGLVLRVVGGAVAAYKVQCWAANEYYRDMETCYAPKSRIATVELITVVVGCVGVLAGEVIKRIICFCCCCQNCECQNRERVGNIITNCLYPIDYRVINSVDELSPGDHIKFENTTVWRVDENAKKVKVAKVKGAVVLSVDKNAKKIKFVCYVKGTGHHEVVYDSLRNKGVYMYMVEWKNQDICRNVEVIGRAVDTLREEQSRLQNIREQNRHREAQS